jgi:hypothetical protein
MNELKLKTLRFGATEALTRAQMKNVKGGTSGDGCTLGSGGIGSLELPGGHCPGGPVYQCPEPRQAWYCCSLALCGNI